MKFLFFISIVLIAVGGVSAEAADPETVAEAKLIRRISIFPFLAPSNLAGEAEDAWWQVREELTRTHFFLVASRHFLNKQEVLQPRGNLKPADVLVLSRLLDAHALVTCQITEDRIHFYSYDGETGWPLWQKSVIFDPDIPIKDQIKRLAVNLTKSFVASFPYQGFTSRNPKTENLLDEINDVKLASVTLATTNQVGVGDLVEWIRLYRKGLGELFREAGRFEVIARGKVISVKEGVASVELLTRTETSQIGEYGLVRFPSEVERLANEMDDEKDPSSLLLKQVQSQSPRQPEQEKSGALITALSFIGNALLFIAIAF